VRGPSSKALSAETPETLAAVTEQTIPDLRRTHHPFDTYSFVSRLERAGVSAGAAHGLMEGVRALLVSRGGEARRTMLSIEEMDKVGSKSLEGS
jgi:hypothetical protein